MDLRKAKVRTAEEVRCDKFLGNVWYTFTYQEILINGIWYGIYEDAEGNEIYSN